MAKQPTIKELQLQISKLNQSNRALKRHADERLAKLNAIKETNTKLKKDNTSLVEENEKLKSELCESSMDFNSIERKQTELEESLREKNDELLKICNELTRENTKLKNTIANFNSENSKILIININ